MPLQDRPSEKIDRSPAASDPIWRERCLPLLDYLGTPRPWVELSSWASEHSVSASLLRNMLAWLDCERLAVSFRRQGAWVWCGVLDAPRGPRLVS